MVAPVPRPEQRPPPPRNQHLEAVERMSAAAGDGKRQRSRGLDPLGKTKAERSLRWCCKNEGGGFYIRGRMAGLGM